MPGQVFTDLAVAIADGADAVTGIEVLRDRDTLFGPVLRNLVEPFRSWPGDRNLRRSDRVLAGSQLAGRPVIMRLARLTFAVLWIRIVMKALSSRCCAADFGARRFANSAQTRTR